MPKNALKIILGAVLGIGWIFVSTLTPQKALASTGCDTATTSIVGYSNSFVYTANGACGYAGDHVLDGVHITQIAAWFNTTGTANLRIRNGSCTNTLFSWTVAPGENVLSLSYNMPSDSSGCVFSLGADDGGVQWAYGANGGGNFPYWYINSPLSLFTSRIVSTQPAIASTTASTSVYLAAEIVNGIPNYTQIHFHIVNIDCGTSESCPDATTDIILPITITGDETLSTTTIFGSGQHIGWVRMEPLTGTDSTSTVMSMSFIVVSSFAAGQITINPAGVFANNATTTLQDCSSQSNTIAYILCRIFLPGHLTYEAIAGVYNIIQTKPPVGYYFEFRNDILSATTTASSTISNWTIPDNINNTLFAPLRTLIATVIWLFILVELLVRIKYIQL